MSETHRLPTFARQWLARRLARPSPPSGPVRNRKVCLYKVDRLGDFVLALGALHQLVDHFQPENCRLVVSTAAEALAAAEFPGVPRWVLPPAASGVWREMRPLRARFGPEFAGENFERLVCLRHAPSLYRDVTLGWIGAREFFGRTSRPTAATLTISNRPALPPPGGVTAPWSAELRSHREVLAAVLGRNPDWSELRPRLRSQTPGTSDEVVFCPFGHERIRDFPRESWRAAWRTLAVPVRRLRLLGPAVRSGELTALRDDLRATFPRADITIQTDLTALQFIGAIAAARAVVTVDSAAAHLATAFDQPAVIVIGGGHHGWFGPWGDRVRQQWISHPLPCFGCNWDCRLPTVSCLTELPPTAVGAALNTVLAHA
jgi:ADP-heptose:LPS heptosyltransferase